MAIDLSTFWSGWDVVGGNTSATNQYDFWKGMTMSNGQVLNNQYEFFKYHNTTRYQWYKNLQQTYPEVYDEYTFYKNTNDPNIYDMRTFYQYGATYLNPGTTTTTTTVPPFDSDAAAYLAAVIATGGTLNSTISGATETLFLDLKTAGLYNKIDVLMPMIGGVKASMILNAKQPTNPSWNWTEYGSALTYASNGITGNNSGVLKSNFTTNDIGLSSTQGHMSIYCNLLPTVGAALNGLISLSPAANVTAIGYLSNWYVGISADNSFAGTTSFPSDGMWLVNRTSSTNQNLLLDGTNIFNRTTTSNAITNQNIAIFSLIFPGQGYSNDIYNGDIGNGRYCSFTAGSVGLTSQEEQDLTDIITAFNTALSRN